MLICDVKKMLSQYDSWSVKHIWTEANVVAHALGQNASSISDVIIDIEEVPFSIQSLL